MNEKHRQRHMNNTDTPTIVRYRNALVLVLPALRAALGGGGPLIVLLLGIVGPCVGASVGLRVGLLEGDRVGISVGVDVGDLDGE